MADDEANEGTETTIETAAASAGEAQEVDPSGVRSRAEEPGMLTPEALDERQEKLRTVRLWGGPDLDAETRARAEAEEDVPDVEPTETEEPAGDST